MKKRYERRKHCALAVVRRAKNFRPATDPLPGGAGRPKFNQLEMVITFTYKVQTQFGEDRCTQFRVIVVTDPQTNIHTNTHTHTHKQTGPITIHCAAKPSAQCNNREDSTNSLITQVVDVEFLRNLF